MRHLVELGHRRIVHIGGDSVSEASRERSGAFLRGVKTFNLNPKECPVLLSNWEVDQARSLVQTILKSSDRPTAVVCANDLIAACTLQVANELKLKVPEQLSVVGMTNERLSRLTIPQITTVSIPEEEIGYQGIMGLVESIGSKEKVAAHKITRYACSTIIRGSSGTVLKR
jgi:LacI family transcriptional regulator